MTSAQMLHFSCSICNAILDRRAARALLSLMFTLFLRTFKQPPPLLRVAVHSRKGDPHMAHTGISLDRRGTGIRPCSLSCMRWSGQKNCPLRSKRRLSRRLRYRAFLYVPKRRLALFFLPNGKKYDYGPSAGNGDFLDRSGQILLPTPAHARK